MSDKAQWNLAMDEVAKECWQQIQITPDQQIIRFHGKPWQLWLNQAKVSTNVQLVGHTGGSTNILVGQDKVQGGGYFIN